MRTSTTRALLGALGLTAAAAFATPATAAPYDGSWTMSVVTTDGHCGVISVGLAISGGHITSTRGKFVMRPIKIAGQVSGGGATKMNAVAGPRQAIGTGHFTKTKGKGKWNGTGPSGVCSGYWLAVRG
ncbi:MAG: hypothetical protein ACRECX_06530 [Methyloceanibacter sp.]|uniref:hypothetical protein n=1 Tax=Methyloceanibacter sp. TaxID=1965321 RepID=UPI003D6CB829